MSNTVPNLSPVRGWVASGGVLPEGTEHGLVGSCPSTKLPLVNLSKVPEKLRNDFRSLFISEQGFTLIYAFAIVHKMSSSVITQKRVIVVGPRSLHLLYMDRQIARCIALEAVRHLYHSNDAWIGLTVSGEHSLAMKFENNAQMRDFKKVLCTLYKHNASGTLDSTPCTGKDTVKAKMQLTKDASWNAKNSRVNFTSLTLEQMAQAQQDVTSLRRRVSPSSVSPVHFPPSLSGVPGAMSGAQTISPSQSRTHSPPPGTPPRHPVAPLREIPASATKEAETISAEETLSPRTQERVNEHRKQLEKKLEKMQTEELRLKKLLADQDDALQARVAASFATSLDRKRICDLLTLDPPADCRCEVSSEGRLTLHAPSTPFSPAKARITSEESLLSPSSLGSPMPHERDEVALEDLVYKEPLACVIEAKLESLEGARKMWLEEAGVLQAEAARVEEEVEAEGLEEVRRELLECYSTRVGSAEELQETEAESRALVEKVALLTEETQGITERLKQAPQVHSENMASLKAQHTAQMAKLNEELRQTLNTPRTSALAVPDAPPEKLSEVAELERQVALAQDELRRLCEEEEASVEAEVLRIKNSAGSDDIGEELRDACTQLQAALARISDLQEVVDTAPALIKDIEGNESATQKLDFESRELVIKSTQMKKDFEARMMDIKIQSDAMDLKLRQLHDHAQEQQVQARQEVREASMQVEQDAERIVAAEQEEQAKLLAAQRASGESERQLDDYYNTRITSPFGKRAEEGELESRLVIVDETIDAVQRELHLLSERDANVREKFHRSEVHMVEQESQLVRRLEEVKSSGISTEQIEDDLTKVRHAHSCLQDSMDTFALQARSTRSRHHQREKALLSRRDELIENLRECSVSTMIDLTLPAAQSPAAHSHAITAPFTPLSPAAPDPLPPPGPTPILVRRDPSEKWGLSCEGMRIAKIVPGSPVCRAGLRIGQLVLSVNGLEVTHREQIYSEFCARETETEIVVRDL